MSLDNPKYQNFVSVTSVVSWAVLFIGVIISVTWYTSRTPDHVTNNQQSQDKITAIDEAFQSALGPRWPYVLLVFTIVLAICLAFLYLASKKEVITINMSDKTAQTFNIVLIVFTVIFGILMIVLAIKQWMDYRRKQNTGDIPGYQPNIQQQKQTKQLMIVIGLGLLVFVGGGFAIWNFFFRDKTVDGQS